MSNKRIQLNVLITQEQKERLRLISALSGNRSMTETIGELIDDKAERLGIDNLPIITTAYEAQQERETA